MAAAPLKRFDHEWIFDAFAGRPTFFTKRMFGGLYIDSSHQDFEATMEGVARRMARNDRRFGVVPAIRRGPPEGGPHVRRRG